MNRRVALLSVLVALLAVAGCAFRPASAQTQTASAGFELRLATYVEIQEALAADNFDEARNQLEEFARVADGATQGLAEAALQANDIEELRAKFKPLSESLTALDLPKVSPTLFVRCMTPETEHLGYNATARYGTRTTEPSC